VLKLPYLLGVSILGATIGWQGGLFAQKPPARQMFGNLTLSPSDLRTTHTLYGISGGAVATQSLSNQKQTETGECIGFVDTEPDHRLTLTQNFKYLRLQVKSSGDTVLLVKGPGGTWCNDDVSDRNPIIAGEWLKGTYSIWVGSYEQNASFPYLLEISGDRR
jgi:hypothetical protein